MTQPTYSTIHRCRLCGGDQLEDLFSLGEQYVSDFVASTDLVAVGPRVPITLTLCRKCTLVQHRHSARQDFLYTRHYWYRSGTNPAMVKALANVVEAANRIVEVQAGDIVLDIGANDGTLLSHSGRYGRGERRIQPVRVAVEPAKNLAEECRRHCDIFIPKFWSAEAYHDHIREYDAHGKAPKAKVITACGMFYDLENPRQFIADVASVLRKDGVFIAQLMCLRQTLRSRDIGNLCHEHLEFYSLRSLEYLFGLFGLEIFDLEENSVNGGSYRLYVRHANGDVRASDPSRARERIRVAREAESLYDFPLYYRTWLGGCEYNRHQCVEFIRKEVTAGKKVWVYGASTKGNTILQWYDLNYIMGYPEDFDKPGGGNRLIQAAADRSPEKWGRYTVGTGIPIRSEEDFRTANPDYALVLPYAFINEFMERESEWRAKGGKFIVPIPESQVV